ncbi:hypothetical protein [Streptomyces sp. GQFP]|uniref:hypothetical protein n=1 Tax=Streptomyces sp. GQFP TaxID=2907545 RepID=UPI001F479424|nr:hypothetical protein [Streptomyces sp. GQFP]UIX34466.1 hypothetical protein LUX31_33160 [Streptomyces sp. GQFP]
MTEIEPLPQLVDYAGIGQGCLVCSDQHVTTTDVEAVAHMASHRPDELAWALLLWAGQTQSLTAWCAENEGIEDESTADAVIGAVETTFDRSLPPDVQARIERHPSGT